MGFSAGALAAPTAAARIHDQLSAVVLIGGGCDIFRISQESSFTNGGLIIFGTRTPESLDLTKPLGSKGLAITSPCNVAKAAALDPAPATSPMSLSALILLVLLAAGTSYRRRRQTKRAL
jgi:hypothetical protein